MSETPEPHTQTEALADMRALLDSVLREMREVRHELKTMRTALGLPVNGSIPTPTNKLDAFIMQTVAEIYRDQGRKPATTYVVSDRIGFSQGHTLRLLKDCAARGLVYLVPGRGKRVSGKWLPMERAA